MMVAVVAIASMILNRLDIKRNGFTKALEKKRDVKDCVEFRKRIGKEVDNNTECAELMAKSAAEAERNFVVKMESGQKRFGRIEKCLIWLVEKQGGDPGPMGLYE